MPLLSGVVANPAAEFIQTYPLNLEPVAIDTKVSAGQFRATPGAVRFGVGVGGDGGGIIWNGKCYRASGGQLIEVTAQGDVTILGSIGPRWNCALDYGFDRLMIVGYHRLFYYDGITITQVTDDDVGLPIDGIWIDGFFMLTDGEFVYVTELSDPLSILPLKYGSAETDPDPITGLLRYREEAYVFGRHTIQVFRNVGGSGFPFAPVPGGTIPFGCVTARAKCLFGDGFAFVGSARGEGLNIYVGGQGSAQPIGNKTICDALAAVADETDITVEARDYGGEKRLLVHLADESWCFLLNASAALKQPIWYRLKSADDGPYRLRHATNFDGRIMVGDNLTAGLGWLDDQEIRHWELDAPPPWQFEAGMLYNEGRGIIVHSAELVGLPGRGNGAGSIFMSMTRDGETWTTDRAITVQPGQRTKRLQWRPHARFSNYMGFRFRGAGMALPGILRLEVNAEGQGA